jgi:serine/threonine-protein kinase
MPDEARLLDILEEILASHRRPEEVCSDSPELLAEVRERLAQIQRVECEIEDIFPSADTVKLDRRSLPGIDGKLPPLAGYHVEGVIGRGGMGVVYKARHLVLNRPVAVKMLLAGAYASPYELRRFRREAEAVAALRHPNIVQVHDAGEVEGRPYFTMEFVEGGSLAQQSNGMPQPVQRAVELVAILAGAVQFAHRSGFVHRDLKPANILVTADGSPKITDFGLALPIHGGDRYTLSGAAVGTPCYMAPEQAQGKINAAGPAVDIYALGAILYELLTGRPPFVGESAAETERNVIGEDPVRPSRLNVKVPRDLEIICLKCLQKYPSRRYASAQDLADDLHRFLDGKPVVARPVGAAERTMKWARRRPALATLLAFLFLLLGGAVGASVWIRHQLEMKRVESLQRKTAAQQAVDDAIQKAIAAGLAERWTDADLNLNHARGELVVADSDALRTRLGRVEEDERFARELDRIRQGTAVSEDFNTQAAENYAHRFDQYRTAFAKVGLDLSGEPGQVAAKIRESSFSNFTVMALDELALAAFKQRAISICRQALQIAQQVEPDPDWSDQLRNEKNWRDRPELLRLAADAGKASKPLSVQKLAILAVLLHDVSAPSDGIRLLAEALRKRPGDYWLNWEMGESLAQEQRHGEAAVYFRVAASLRPDDAHSLSRLGAALMAAGEFEEGVGLFRRALQLDPGDGALVFEYAVALTGVGRPFDAVAECRRACETDPSNGFKAFSLGRALTFAGRHEESIPVYQRAAELHDAHRLAYLYLAGAQGWCGRYADAEVNFRKFLAIMRTNITGRQSYGLTLQLQDKYDQAVVEFESLIRELDRVGDRSSEDYKLASFHLAESLFALGHFTETNEAAQRALKLPGVEAWWGNRLHRLIEMSGRLAPLVDTLPALKSGRERVADPAIACDLAEWCYKSRRSDADAVRFYEDAFNRQPALADDLQHGNRFHAACAAARAGCGLGGNTASLDESERAALHKKALAWLQAQQELLLTPKTSDKSSDAEIAVRTFLLWQKAVDLACVRETAALAKLPEPARLSWQTFWSDIDALVSRASFVRLERARQFADHKEWVRAAEAYAALLNDAPKLDSEVWFECAAVQLLANDRRAYDQTFKHMYETHMRSFLVARAWTLTAERATSLPDQFGRQELHRNTLQFWSLTEQGALACRSNRPADSTPLFRQSLKANTQAGPTVVNWLWLALSCQKRGEIENAQQWLKKAVSWLDGLGDERPDYAESRWGWHRHNWLEAQILRREAQQLIEVACP